MSKIKGSYKDIAERYLLKDLDTINSLKNGERINSIPLEILRRIIEDDEYYNYAMKVFEHDFFFRMGVPRGEDITNIMVFEKKDILNALADLLNSQRIMVTESARERFDNLCNTNTVSVNELREMYTEDFVIEKNGKKYSIPFKEIFDIIENPQSIESKSMNEEDKEVLLQTAQLFIKKLIKDRNGTLARVKINSKLRETIVEEMYDDFDIFERAMFIYIKLCKKLSYSDEFYTLWMLDDVKDKYLPFENIESITPTNNETVCAQVEMIYLRFLGELGVGLDKDDLFKIEQEYGTEHVEFTFMINGCLIHADPVKSLIYNDLMGLKLNLEIAGLECISQNEQDIKKFKTVLNKIYKIIQDQEMEKEDNKRRLDEFKEKYSILTGNSRPVDFAERTSVLVDAINSTQLKGLDAIGNIIRLRKSIFTEEQNEKNVNMVIVRNLDTSNIRKKAVPTLVISINQIGFEESPDRTTYYLYNPGHPLEKISKEKLQIKCGIGTISYIEEGFKIPGIKYQEFQKERIVL